MGIGILRNPVYEAFAQHVVAGKSPKEACDLVGRKSANTILKRTEVQNRIRELTQLAADRAMMSRGEILNRMLDDWELARKLGQVSAAAKIGELMGRDLHRMFVERKEVGGPGDFDTKTEQELRDFIAEQLTELKTLGVADIELSTNQDIDPSKLN